VNAFAARLRAALVTPFVPASFGSPGFRAREPLFDRRDLEVDLTGEAIGVTGGTSGIGLATARALANLGAAVTLFGRDAKKGERAARAIDAECRGTARFVRCDVGDFASIDAAVRALGPEPFDRFVHNASILPHERRLSPEGFESTYATNIVGPLRLEHRMDPAHRRLRRTVWVSSGGMYLVPLDLTELRGDVRRFDGVRAYAQTKRAQILVARAMSRTHAGRCDAFSMHPGWADTPSVVDALPRFHRMTQALLRTPEQGADTAVWLTATPRALQPGGFYFDRELQDPEVFPGTRASVATLEALFDTLARDADVPRAYISASVDG
jgi:NAD(P)-dependent dehydrogenase (short-subunit alcohol dehydrogenase family)